MNHHNDKANILDWLRTTDPELLAQLWELADSARKQSVGEDILLRGIIEFSNICSKDCLYCGINCHVKGISRYTMSADEILTVIRRFPPHDIHTVVLQSGESSHLSTAWVTDLVKRIKDCGDTAITLALGERPHDDYAEWKEAGAERYLLKIETSNPTLYNRLHPSKPNGWEKRIACLKVLHQLDYEVGSGGMIGLPGQTYDDLANDMLLLRELDIDMIGMGPFIPHPDTPLGYDRSSYLAPVDQVPNDDLMTYKTVALLRLISPYTNLPATTALATVDPTAGTMNVLQRGANVMMPNCTPVKYKEQYDIYPNPKRQSKQGVDDSAVMDSIVGNVFRLVKTIGRTIGKDNGLSLNFLRRREGLERHGEIPPCC